MQQPERGDHDGALPPVVGEAMRHAAKAGFRRENSDLF